MTQKNKDQLIKRLKSLGWRIMMVVIAIIVDFIARNIGLFELPAEVTVVIGLVLGEISKYLNKKTDGNK